MESAPEIYDRILKLSEFGNQLSLRTISHPEYVVLDPKLMVTFCRCYKTWSLDYFFTAFKIAERPAFNDLENGTEIAYHVPIQSFRTADNFLGFRALWIWQCQKTATSFGNGTWALRIEAMFNWLRFFERYGSMESVERLATRFIDKAEARFGRPQYAELFEWLSVLSGVYCTIPVRSYLQFPGRTTCSEIFRHAPYRQIRTPGGQSIQSDLWLEESEEFDAAFILSGPFKLLLTDNIMEHLTFSTKNPQTLLIYYNDTQRNPGLGAIMFQGNIIADGFGESRIVI